MKFIIFVIDNHSESATGDEIEEITAFNQDLRSKGQLLLAEGITAPKKAKVFDFRGENNVVDEGSLIKGEYFYSGFWLIEADSLDAAEEIAQRGSKSCNRRVELRPLY